jgi:hypothetical protein
VETTRKNKQFGIRYYTDTISIRGQTFAFSIFGRSFSCGEVDAVKRVSVQPHWALSGFNESFMEFIRFIAERGNWNEKNRMEVNC